MTKRQRQNRKNQVVLEARNCQGELVESHQLSTEEYYESNSELVDSASYRRRRSITSLEGWIYDPGGMLDQHFVNRYNADGAYEGGRTEHADGTVCED